jgi:hypothetical protein
MGGKGARDRLPKPFVMSFTEPVEDIEHFGFASADVPEARRAGRLSGAVRSHL